jgi:predicted homoserine dehydrogenase-like protein
MNSEVCTIAKRTIKAGEKVKGIGSADIFGKIFNYKEARALKAIPLGIAENGIALTEIPKGTLITEANFCPDQSTLIYNLRREQDNLIAK